MSWQEIAKKYDLDISVIELSEVIEINRLDAEFYKPEHLITDKFLKSKKYFMLNKNEVVSGPFGSTLKSEEYIEKGVRLIRVQDIKQRYFLDKELAVFISEESNNKIKNSELKTGDLVVSKVGNTIGLIAHIDEELKRANVSENNIGIKLDSYSESAKYTILAFLNSKYGQSQILRRISGNAQPKLNVFNFTEIIIPIVSAKLQDEIAKIIKSAYELRISSEKSYSQAEQLLLTELGLADYVPNEANTSIRDLFECLQDDRFDAEYWMPKYDEMQKRVAKVPQKKLGQIVSYKKGIEVGSEAYQEEGENFIRVSDFSIYGIEGVEKKISSELYENLKMNYQPKKGEVLFTKDGTIGLSYALDEDIKGILSGAFLRLQPKTNINLHYLALVLNSLYCKYQIGRAHV